MLAGAQHNVLDALLHTVLAGAVLPGRQLARGVRVAARGTGGSRGAAVGQPRGAWAPRKLLDRLRASLRQKAPALCFAFARVLRQLLVFIIAAELYLLAVSLQASRSCVFLYYHGCAVASPEHISTRSTSARASSRAPPRRRRGGRAAGCAVASPEYILTSSPSARASKRRNCCSQQSKIPRLGI